MWPRRLKMRDGLGLHLEPELASMVELQVAAGGAARVVCAGSCALPAGSIVDSRVRQPQAVTTAIKGLLAECGSQAQRVSLALPPRGVVLRRLEMPVEADEHWRRRLASEAAQELLGVEGAELAVDCRVVAAQGLLPDRCEVLMVAARLEAVRDRLELAAALGLQAVAIEVETHAVVRAVQAIRSFVPAGAAPDSRGPALLVEVGARGFRVVPLTGVRAGVPTLHGNPDPEQDRAADRVFEQEQSSGAEAAGSGSGSVPMPDADEVLRLMEHACVATPAWRPKEVLWAAVAVDPQAWEALQARSPWPMRRLDPWSVWGEGPPQSSEPVCSPGLATWGLALRSLQVP